MEENGDAKTCYPITLGEENNEGNHRIYELKAEESERHKTAEDIQNEEVRFRKLNLLSKCNYIT